MLASALAVSSIAGISGALAEDRSREGGRAGNSSDQRDVDTMVVIGRRWGIDPTQRERMETATVVFREEAELQQATVAFDALRHTPGLGITQRTGFLGTGMNRLSIRGLGASGPSGVQVFIDGRPDPTASFVHPIGQAHTMGDVQSLEIIHGPSPVLHGSGKAGVVNIRTITPEQGYSGYLRASIGTEGTTENMLVGSFGGKRGFLRASGSYRRTDGAVPETDARVASGQLRGRYHLDERWSLTGSVSHSDDTFATPGEIDVVGPFGSPGTETLDLAQTAADIVIDGRFQGAETSLQLWGFKLDPRSQAVSPGVSRADIHETGVRSRTVVELPRGYEMTAGADLLYARARNTPPPPPGNSLPPPGAPELSASSREIAPYVQLSGPITPALSWAGGVRIVNHSEYGTEPAGELGMRLNPGAEKADHPLRDTTFRVRATRGYQSPPLQQLFGIFIGGPAGPSNANLEPEILDQIELGWNQRFAAGELDMVFFVQSANDLVQAVGGPPPPPPQLRNAGSFTHRGLELRTVLRPHPRLAVTLGGTTRDLSDGIIRLPHHTIDVALMASLMRHRDLTLRVSGRAAFDTFDLDDTGQRTRLSNYFVADVNLMYRASAHVKPFVRINNITDTSYQTWFGIPMPGITALAGVTVEF